ncbi:sensor histidine kinase [Auritidibacter ignavus]|uniref:sensor histidine kinase n=1 Tax=Auritidibacter ignavus TaxID=678932 RepID=UPI002448D908|nr:HAMP domain-containing sensor histidine kinase [Auritidibacter ignavus]WGH86101.1 HAMP domain-containing sensor histidine kinase [Auritidibacter ignavus]WGH88385.1 HAMP domain-containing sensor histidine kinase [Auritidibacter ignavus]
MSATSSASIPQPPQYPPPRPHHGPRTRNPVKYASRSWRSFSLRTQLTVITSLLMLATVMVTAVLTASLYRHELIRSMDEDLFANRSNVSVYLTSLGQADQYLGDFQQSIVRFYGESWTNDGQVVASIRSEGSDTPAIEPMTAEEAIAQGNTPFTVPGRNEEGKSWRVQVYRLDSGSGSVAVALPMAPIEESVERVTTLVVSIGLLATVVATVIAYVVVTRSFRPLNRVQRTASKIAAGDLTQRVPPGPPDTEVGRLARSLNAMLAHIENAFHAKESSESRMRRFVQDASHELRTPLVTIRGFSELYRHGAITNDDDVKTAMSRIESEATRMTQLVEDLLTLARLDELRDSDQQPVDLLVLASDAVLDTRASAPDRTIQLVGLETDQPESAMTTGDENKLRQVISNLITNALRYTPDGTPLEIAVGSVDVLSGLPGSSGASNAEERNSVIEIRDHGPGISEEDASRIFERFYRADSSRHRQTGGTGLGLAIVAGIVSQHGGSVRLQETPGGGATMSVRLPWRPSDEAVEDDSDDDDATDDEPTDQDEMDETNAGADQHHRSEDPRGA